VLRLPVEVDKRSLAHQLVSYLHFLARASVRLAQLHHQDAYRTVQVHNLPDFLVLSAVVPKARGVPVILDLHDLMPEFFAGRFGTARRALLPALIRAQERLACRFADHVITVSDAWRETLVSRGVPRARSSVVLNVADDRIFNPRPRRPASAPGFRIIYHGQVTRRYGLDLAVRAMKVLEPEIPGLHLTIRGRGDAVTELEDLVRALQLEDTVELCHDSVPAEALADIIAGADLGIVPYRDDVFTDGIVPTKLMEYAAVGIPCVAARTTAINAYFADTMVEFFAPDDVDDLVARIRALHADRARLDDLAVGARRFTSRYSWAQVSAGYVALVDALGTGTPILPTRDPAGNGVTSSPPGTPAAPRRRHRARRSGRTRIEAGSPRASS
jgi:glycosyltransferase involved in cell wall biosynthesis